MASNIQRLLHITKGRNKFKEYTSINFRLLKTLKNEFRKHAKENNTSMNVIIEAIVRGYVRDHPAVLAMIDQWMRDEGIQEKPQSAPKMNKNDLDEIHAAIKSGMFIDED
jgi:hypothetical protein